VAGNSKRKGAMRKTGTKKGAVVGSGGQKSKGLEGKGPTPRATIRPGHPQQRKAAMAAKQQQQRRASKDKPVAELVAGLRANVPTTALYVQIGIDADERVTEAVRMAADRGVSVLEVSKPELDRLTNGALHQGLSLQMPPFEYAHPDELLSLAKESAEPGLLVALDGVTDPRNLGAVIRSAAAFGANGVLLPQRRSAGITAVAWRTSAGAAAKIPVAIATNLTRTLRQYAAEGMMIVGLDADGSITVDQLSLATSPLVVVVGSEGRGLGRLVREACDETVSIPMSAGVDSLNASVAAGVVLAEVSRRRRVAGRI